jgi:dipeptidyl aminopeptidase/acylaminoacyl peptidase
MRQLTFSLLLLALTPLAIAAVDPIIERHPVQPSPEVAKRARAVLSAVHVDAITYMSDGLHIRGYLAVPNGAGPFPCLIFNHGGNSNVGVAFEPDRAVESLGKIASWGYIVIASQYRGQVGSGEGHDDFGGAETDDVMNLFPIIDSLPSADRTRIGMIGASRGAMTTYLSLLRTDRIRAAVSISGVSDLFEGGKARPEMEANYKRFMPDYAAGREAALARRSAVRWAEKLPANVPILLMHGTADWRVSPVQALDMTRALYAAKHPVRLMMFEGGSHGLPEFLPERDGAMRAFLDAYVRDGKKWPDLTPHGN